MKPLTDKQKKYLWIAAGVLIVAHFMLPRIVGFFHATTVHSASAKPSPYVYAPVAPALPPPPPPSPEAVAFTKFGGVWVGDNIDKDLEHCGIHLEVKLTDDLQKQLKGYLQHRCVDMQSLQGQAPSRSGIAKMIQQQTAPDSLVMTGKPENGGITFTIDQMVVASDNQCGPINTFNIVDFGSGQVIARWQEGTCAPQSMPLRRGR